MTSKEKLERALLLLDMASDELADAYKMTIGKAIDTHTLEALGGVRASLRVRIADMGLEGHDG